MTAEDEAIATGRATVSTGWVWAPGQVMLMIVEHGDSRTVIPAVVTVLYEGVPISATHLGGGLGVVGEMVPDMRDPGTLECVRTLILGAWSAVFPRVEVEVVNCHTFDPIAVLFVPAVVVKVVVWCDKWRTHWASEPMQTRAEALVAALKAAPRSS